MSELGLPGPGGVYLDPFSSKEAGFVPLFLLWKDEFHEEYLIETELSLSAREEEMSVEGAEFCCFLDHPEDPEAPPTRAMAGSFPDCSLRREGRFTGRGIESLKLELLEEEEEDEEEG